MSPAPVALLLTNILHFLATFSLAILSGIALSLTIWCIPLVRLAPTTSSKIRQFNHIIQLGFTYLQPSSRIIPACLVAAIAIAFTNGDPRWKHYVATVAVMIPTGPWEVYLVFPINDEIKAMGQSLEKGKEDFGNPRDQELERRLDDWVKWHTGRIVAPMLGTGILLASALDMLPF
ncbi:uncharacterized protein AB675_3453 [Cyphellophora attinorum]|uniref:DUF1772-domain-containing protein n=1 Tax=Cyphellophora attinorum TaxID=1664694 RepID=A0A0N1P015_9EURO|nr:uncharacterized protein AB675_3453 [Phialophora attinorum]KPI39652.1 hypothetical protein AB675_3453 [Phialophora attinorum]